MTDLIVDYLIAQCHAGAQLLQIFESWAGELGPDLYETYSLPYLIDIATRVKAAVPGVPMTIFAKGAHWALADLGKSPYDVVSLDWTMDPAKAREVVGKDTTLQGNLDPCALYGSAETIDAEVKRMADSFGTQRWIANLGHGMMPTHDPEHAKAFIEVSAYHACIVLRRGTCRHWQQALDCGLV